jgi:cbb3-type cytochrome oxidase subunit 3
MNELLQTVLRSAVTVMLFALFIALVVWAWSPRRRNDFAAAAYLVFDQPGEPRVEQEEKP